MLLSYKNSRKVFVIYCLLLVLREFYSICFRLLAFTIYFGYATNLRLFEFNEKMMHEQHGYYMIETAHAAYDPTL